MRTKAAFLLFVVAIFFAVLYARPRRVFARPFQMPVWQSLMLGSTGWALLTSGTPVDALAIAKAGTDGALRVYGAAGGGSSVDLKWSSIGPFLATNDTSDLNLFVNGGALNLWVGGVKNFQGDSSGHVGSSAALHPVGSASLGNATQPWTWVFATNVRPQNSGSLALMDNAETTELTIGTNGPQFRSVTQATLPAAGNGTILYCSDCTVATSPCTAGSTGAMAFRVNGAWRCQ